MEFLSFPLWPAPRDHTVSWTHPATVILEINRVNLGVSVCIQQSKPQGVLGGFLFCFCLLFGTSSFHDFQFFTIKIAIWLFCLRACLKAIPCLSLKMRPSESSPRRIVSPYIIECKDEFQRTLINDTWKWCHLWIVWTPLAPHPLPPSTEPCSLLFII